MTTAAATATATQTPASKRREPRAGHPRPAASAAPQRRPSDLPRDYRIAHVYRTLGRGLVAEYDLD